MMAVIATSPAILTAIAVTTLLCMPPCVDAATRNTVTILLPSQSEIGKVMF
jgi:hypothetical protein